MKISPPRYETRRTADFLDELQQRAKIWIPRWGLTDGDPDFGVALLQVAARFCSEVAERLDKTGDKMMRGLFDWLAVRGKAARPARVPVVFKLADSAKDAVVTVAPVKLQASVGSASVYFETESDLRIVPGSLASVVGVSPADDAFYLPPPGLSDLSPVDPAPGAWRLVSAPVPESVTLQLDPALGLAKDMLLSIAGQQYRISDAPNGNLVKIDPPLAGTTLPAGTQVSKVVAFLPFAGARNQQEHVLYLGDDDLFNIGTKATIEVIGGQQLGDGVTWEYWGKVDPPPIVAGVPNDDSAWQPMSPYTGTPPGDAIALVKPNGSVDVTQVGKLKSRWIRGRTTTVTSGPIQLVDPVQARINALPPPIPDPQDSEPAQDDLIPLDIFVNSTPAPAHDFYPLGLQPRLFDTLYVGCPEAFSKPNANARIRFQLAEATLAATAAIDAGGLGGVIAGVDVSGALHLLSVKSDGTLARLRDAGARVPPAPGTKLTSKDMRPVMWMEGATLCVAVLAGKDVWIWREDGVAASNNAWANPLGAPPYDTDAGSAVTCLAALYDLVFAKTVLFALRDGKVSWFDSVAGAWNPFLTQIAGVDVTAAALAPVLWELDKTPSIEILTVLDDGRLSAIASTALPLAPPVGANVSSTVLPFGMYRHSGAVEIIALKDTQDRLLAWSTVAPFTNAIDLEVAFQPFASTSIDGHVENGNLVGYLPVKGSGTRDLISWAPFDPIYGSVVFEFHGDPALPIPNGPPTLLHDWAYVPCIGQGDILGIHLSGTRAVLNAPAASFVSAFATVDPLAAVAQGDTIGVPLAGGDKISLVASPYLAQGRDANSQLRFALLDKWIDCDTAPFSIYTFNTSAGVPFQGMVPVAPPPPPAAPAGSTYFQLDAGDNKTARGDHLVIADGTPTGRFVPVTAVAGGIAIVTSLLPSAPGTLVNYWVAASVSLGQIFPAQSFTAANNTWDASALRSGDFYYLTPPVDPVRQRVAALAQDNAIPPMPAWVALDTAWTTAPAAATQFVVDSLVTDLTLVFADTSSNPLLSWEYWNGASWVSLTVTQDTTNQLRTSGRVQFTVPTDLKSTVWAGKTSYWVRARLVGGDYGQEKVIVITTPITSTPNATQQVVTRTTDGIQPPHALAMWVRYSVDTAVVPKYLQSKDSGSTRDQSDANRAPSALVEVFTPLAVALQRLERQAASDRASIDCPPDCPCNGTVPAAVTPPLASTSAAGASAAVPSRAIFLGFTSPLSDAPVNTLLMVDQERNFDSLAPLRVDALAGDHMTPVIASDTTRALGESGVLSMSFTAGPIPADLFGTTLSWLRLSPSGVDPTLAWTPGLRGAYVNAVWARGQETLTREPLGSSDGAPNITVSVARPPVLDGALELRINEPLGDEEIHVLRAQQGSDYVLTGVENLPGSWVRWNQVVDPLDEDAAARVYSLDEGSGLIQFGDGQHGAIPPIGRDCIVAFTYQRTEPGSDPTVAPGNSVAARMPLNLVSPVPTVESVIAADAAAGGAPPDTDEFILRFEAARLRHRDRAISATDLEDLAVESSPEIAQARGLADQQGIRLIVVMKGANPLPNSAQVRELKRLLLAAGSPELNAPGALRIEPPSLREIRVDLTLRVAGLEHVGALGEWVKAAIARFFDAATGGSDGAGWPLGSAPRDDDIAMALQDAPNLEDIAAVTFREIAADGTDRAFDGTINASDLVVSAQEPVRLQFEIIEAVA
jgi:hypothetical protein